MEIAMSDEFGLLNSVASPFLERITREERLSGDQPRKQKLLKAKTAKKDQDSAPSEGNQKTDDSTSSQHIDLRI
jgi:hypothetical protein